MLLRFDWVLFRRGVCHWPRSGLRTLCSGIGLGVVERERNAVDPLATDRCGYAPPLHLPAHCRRSSFGLALPALPWLYSRSPVLDSLESGLSAPGSRLPTLGSARLDSGRLFDLDRAPRCGYRDAWRNPACSRPPPPPPLPRGAEVTARECAVLPHHDVRPLAAGPPRRPRVVILRLFYSQLGATWAAGGERRLPPAAAGRLTPGMEMYGSTEERVCANVRRFQVGDLRWNVVPWQGCLVELCLSSLTSRSLLIQWLYQRPCAWIFTSTTIRPATVSAFLRVLKLCRVLR